MAIRAKKDGESAQLDLTSMIDVVFLLLIFFMVATKFKEVERLMDAYLPKDQGPSKAKPDEPEEEIRIQLVQASTTGGRMGKAGIFVNKVAVVNFEALYRKLLELNAISGDAPVILEPKANVGFDAVIQSLNACTRANIAKVSFSQPAMVIEGVNDGP